MSDLEKAAHFAATELSDRITVYDPSFRTSICPGESPNEQVINGHSDLLAWNRPWLHPPYARTSFDETPYCLVLRKDNGVLTLQEHFSLFDMAKVVDMFNDDHQKATTLVENILGLLTNLYAGKLQRPQRQSGAYYLDRSNKLCLEVDEPCPHQHIPIITTGLDEGNSPCMFNVALPVLGAGQLGEAGAAYKKLFKAVNIDKTTMRVARHFTRLSTLVQIVANQLCDPGAIPHRELHTLVNGPLIYAQAEIDQYIPGRRIKNLGMLEFILSDNGEITGFYTTSATDRAFGANGQTELFDIVCAYAQRHHKHIHPEALEFSDYTDTVGKGDGIFVLRDDDEASAELMVRLPFNLDTEVDAIAERIREFHSLTTAR